VMLLEIYTQYQAQKHPLTLLCGKTDAPLIYSSSLMVTSSPNTVMFSNRA
jgi:hypothetical protein